MAACSVEFKERGRLQIVGSCSSKGSVGTGMGTSYNTQHLVGSSVAKGSERLLACLPSRELPVEINQVQPTRTEAGLLPSPL